MAQAFTALMEMAKKFWFRPHLPLQPEYQHNTLGVTLTEASRKSTGTHICDNILNYKIQRYCMDGDGNDVLIQAEGTESETETEDSEDDQEESSSEASQNCHFHAGVE